MTSPRILLVDDDERLAEMLSTYLSSRGFVVEHRADAGSGFKALEHGRYDALVLDVMLPDLDGFGVRRKLRSFSDLPVLMLTARGENTDRTANLGPVTISSLP